MTIKLYRVEITCSFYVVAKEDSESLLESDSFFHFKCLENEISFPDMVSVEQVEKLNEIPAVWKDASPYPYPSRFQIEEPKLCKEYVEYQPQLQPPQQS